MFEKLLTCNPDYLYFYVEKIYELLKDDKDAEQLIRIVWKRIPELTDEQEKELHKLGRKIRKKFHMKPIII